MGEPAENEQIPDGTSPLILLVDDDVDNLNLLQLALRNKGYRTRSAENGDVALKVLKEEMPQLILLDMRMPVMDGGEFAGRFREKYGRSIPIIVMTVAEDSKLRADEIGADAYLGKPFDLPELHEVVEDTVLAQGLELPR